MNAIFLRFCCCCCKRIHLFALYVPCVWVCRRFDAVFFFGISNSVRRREAFSRTANIEILDILWSLWMLDIMQKLIMSEKEKCWSSSCFICWFSLSLFLLLFLSVTAIIFTTCGVKCFAVVQSHINIHAFRWSTIPERQSIFCVPMHIKYQKCDKTKDTQTHN